MAEPFRLTYATMFNPPDELHTNFEAEVAKIKNNLGREFPMLIDGQDVFADEKFDDRSPINTDMVLGVFQKGNADHAEAALQAARRAAKGWGETDWQARVAMVRKAAERMDARIYEFGAVIALEVGKNRMEALADAAETADLLRYAADQMEENDGFVVEMGKDPLVGFEAQNFSFLKPYGVWLVISPFNFPAALTGGPVGAALVAGNTVVIKPATDTPWTSRLIAECFLEAGFPDGVVNYVTGPGRTLGQALVESKEVDGITFTGSYGVGMKIYQDYAKSEYPRPIILEMGGKNPAVVTENADLDQAAQGIFRSAFGLQGQKCSATSRVLVHESVYDELVGLVKDLTESAVIGDPTEKATFLGPVANQGAYNDYKSFTEDLDQAGNIVIGGKVRTEGAFGKGYYCEPTIVTDVPLEHRLWKQEMFVPITMVHKFNTLDEAIHIANDVNYGLTAGIYGTEDEVSWFFGNIEAGVVYANRPQGATTGAWPGFQPFGGWKGSGSSGKNAGGKYYLQLYMHEQINTVIR
ncbi:MAG TPA: aldehyde dehydrogenase family protein [Anaerolineales bacterium]|nr:aldehyde dehydrogenase family protein [Anaerolineales bacterium]